MPENSEVKVGQVWADKDPRSEGRHGTVDRIHGERVWVKWNTGRTTRVAMDRLKSQYSLVPE